jgi:hypothetical protein
MQHSGGGGWGGGGTIACQAGLEGSAGDGLLECLRHGVVQPRGRQDVESQLHTAGLEQVARGPHPRPRKLLEETSACHRQGWSGHGGGRHRIQILQWIESELVEWVGVAEGGWVILDFGFGFGI